jgi:hypothetical protein
MINLESELKQEVNWRIDEISIIKTLPHLYKMRNYHKDIIKKYSIPALYSLWEGFFVASMELYVRKINELNLNRQYIHINILSYDLDCKHQLGNPRINVENKIKITKELEKFFDSKITISSKIQTESNVNYKVLNKVLRYFNLRKFDKKYFKDGLNKLLMYRNSIAHGENSFEITDKIISELSEVVIKCMDNLQDILIDGIKNKTYLRCKIV